MLGIFLFVFCGADPLVFPNQVAGLNGYWAPPAAALANDMDTAKIYLNRLTKGIITATTQRTMGSFIVIEQAHEDGGALLNVWDGKLWWNLYVLTVHESSIRALIGNYQTLEQKVKNGELPAPQQQGQQPPAQPNAGGAPVAPPAAVLAKGPAAPPAAEPAKSPAAPPAAEPAKGPAAPTNQPHEAASATPASTVAQPSAASTPPATPAPAAATAQPAAAPTIQPHEAASATPASTVAQPAAAGSPTPLSAAEPTGQPVVLAAENPTTTATQQPAAAPTSAPKAPPATTQGKKDRPRRR